MKSCNSSISKSLRVLKLRKRVPVQLYEVKPETDYILETEGNIREYLSPLEKYSQDSELPQGQLLKHNIIGPLSHLEVKVIEPNSTRSKKLSCHSINKNQTRQSILVAKVDYQSRFNEVMKKINDALEKAKYEEKLEKIEEDLQVDMKNIKKEKKQRIKSISKVESARFTNELCIESGKINKQTKSVNINSDHLAWYMSLRQTQENEYNESYMRIGPELNGLYTKIKLPNPTFRSPRHPSSESFDDLIIKGESKLNLEVEAVKKIGVEYLRPDLLELTPGQPEEIIVSNYPKQEFN